MKALIWADLHAHNFKEFSTLDNGTNSRLFDCADVVEHVLLSAREEGVSEIWFVGDSWHLKNNLDNQVIQTIMHEMKHLATEFKFYLIPGNHDYRMFGSEPILLEILEDLPGEFTLCKGGWLPGFQESGVYVEPYTRKTIELNKRIAELETDPEADVFFGHQDVIGMHYGGFTVEYGLDADMLSKKFRWSFVGHYHNSVKIKDNVISVGAPLQHNFGDVGEERGWWILDTKKEEAKFIKNDFSPQFIDYTYDPRAEEKDVVPGNPERDFYRIKVAGHVELPDQLKQIKWKRVSYAIEGQTKKRTTISFGDRKEDIVEKYVDLRGGDLDHKKLIEIGRRYL